MLLRKVLPALAGVMILLGSGCGPQEERQGRLEKESGPGGHGDKPPSGEDWPQWRYDAYRSACSPSNLPPKLHLAWVRRFEPRRPAWDDPLNHDLMTYDRVFEPVVAGNLMFVGFNDRDKLVALDIRSGREAWTFYADGPVRLAPAAWGGNVYFVSDDGCLYCVQASDGALVWRFRGAPLDRKTLGNGRLVSAWPARGGPVIRDGVVYFAASIWPFMGTFIHALDARTGKVVWSNDGTGSMYIKQPHSAPAFGGVAPQGPLVATHDYLVVPGGRSVPAVFDRRGGNLLHYLLDDGGKGNGGSFVVATDTNYFVHTRERGTRMHELKSGKKSSFLIAQPVLAEGVYYSSEPASGLRTAVREAEEKLLAAQQTEREAAREVARSAEEGDRLAYRTATNSLASALRKLRGAEADLARALTNLGTNWSGPVIRAVGLDRKTQWEIPTSGSGEIIQAGQRLYVAWSNTIVTVRLDGASPPAVVATNTAPGVVERLLAARGCLFAVTLDGQIAAYRGQASRPLLAGEEVVAPQPAPAARDVARALIGRCESAEGYALWFGLEDAALLEAVVAESRLHVVVVDPDGTRVERLRRQFDRAGWYGKRVALHVGQPGVFEAPPYFANLVVVEAALTPALTNGFVARTVYESVRPYGGVLCLRTDGPGAEMLGEILSGFDLPKARIRAEGSLVTVVREGALPGAAEWTHQYGNVANTVKSDDQLVRLPLGLLWFGGPSNMDVLPRHGHGPSEQVAGGRLIIEGMSGFSARDVYTGRVLWKREVEGLDNFGVYYDASYTNTPLSIAYNQKHIPGANARGANYVVSADEVYVAVSNACLVLNARDGTVTRRITLPTHPDEMHARQWGFIGVYGDLLLGGDGFSLFSERFGVASTNSAVPPIVDLSASRGLVVFDRHSGRELWRADAEHGFVHNGIVAGGGLIYCLDKLPRSLTDKLRRRGKTAPANFRLVAFEAGSGRKAWETRTNIFGTWLGYSERHDVLLQAGASATDRLKDESDRGMIAYRGKTGVVLWRQLDLKYNGPCILHGDAIFTTPGSYKTNSGVFGLLDGKPRLITNPLTGEQEPWRIYRTYGCNYPVACEHLITFRSGAAGFYDLEGRSGTGNLGGFKSGCSANLLAADGVLNAPDYTRTCSCPYQNQTSLALVRWPGLEFWTHNQFGVDARDGTRVKRVGINFGAPGDRLSETGTLWLDHPNVGGSSPNVMVALGGRETNFFRFHSSQVAGGDAPAWVVASGVRNVETVMIAPETRKPGAPPPAPKKKSEEDDDDEEEESNGTNAVASASAGVSNGMNRTSNAGSNLIRLAGGNPAAEGATNVVSTNRAEKAYVSRLKPVPYRVRLFFAEPDEVRPGERVFDVHLQGSKVLDDFDIRAESGGRLRGIVKEFSGIPVGGELTVEFSRANDSIHGPVVCGVELILEGAGAAEHSSGD